MFERKKKEDVIEELIDDLTENMKGKEGTEEYSKMVDAVVELSKVDVEKRKLSISKDTLLIVGGNILGILIILAYEQRNIISTQAMKFVSKGRV